MIRKKGMHVGAVVVNALILKILKIQDLTLNTPPDMTYLFLLSATPGQEDGQRKVSRIRINSV